MKIFHDDQTKPDWRDEDMPCWQTVRFFGGVVVSGYVTKEFVAEDCARRFNRDPVPHWRSDPTYHGIKKRR